jgi:hypothetical protein
MSALRKQRRGARRSSAVEPPWPGLIGRVRWSVAARSPSTVSLVLVLAVLVGVLTGVSFLLPGRMGIPAATTGALSVLWQVQATSVGLVLALVVFVFGLLPQGRGRLSYREFLRRTWALPLTVFNVASLLYNGMVLLGAGRQVPPVGTVAGHGWAVTVASVVALLSAGSIVVILAQALRAIDPATVADVQRRYLEVAVALATRGELFERESLRLLVTMSRPCRFMPSYPLPSLTIRVAGLDKGVVRDVSVWRLWLLRWAASRMGHSEPVIRAWPGEPVNSRTPLLSIDVSSSRGERWWARRCVRLRPAPPGRLEGALTALHGETLEHIRASRPTEATAGMRELGSLQELVWQAYEAHSRIWGSTADRLPVLFNRGVGERVVSSLANLLQSAAVSRDEAIWRDASGLPRTVAREALSGQLSAAIEQNLRQLDGVYAAVVGELSDGGRSKLPVTGLARTRLHEPFGSLLSFVNEYLGPRVDQTGAGGSIGWDGRPLPPAGFLFAQLRVANELMLTMLRRAVLFRDGATIRQVLEVWKIPDLPLAENAIQQATGSGTGGPRGLAQSVGEAQADLDAMMLRLFATAVDTDHSTRQSTLRADVAGNHSEIPEDSSPDPAIEAILARLPERRLWGALDRALQNSAGDWAWKITDDRIVPSGVVVTLPIDHESFLTDAFVLAVIARPELVAGTEPPRPLMLDRGQALITAVDKALVDRLPWFVRHGCPAETAARQARELKTRLGKAVRDAVRELEEETRKAPIRLVAVDRLREAALAAFRRCDITGALFTWAGQLVSGSGLGLAEVDLSAQRSTFTSADLEGMMDSYGRQLGSRLASTLFSKMLIKAAQAGQHRTVRGEEAAAAVRDAIDQLSARPPSRAGGEIPAARTVVFIPDALFGLRHELETVGAAQPDGPGAFSRALRDLGAVDGNLPSYVAGTIDGALIIPANVLDRDIVAVVDLARFAELRLAAPDGTHFALPDLDVAEPEDALRGPNADGASAPDPSSASDLGLLFVQVKLRLARRVVVDDHSAAYVLKIM